MFDVILPGIQQHDKDIRKMAVKCLGLFCLLDKDVAQKQLMLFRNIVSRDAHEIRLVGLKVLTTSFMLLTPVVLI